MPHELDMSTGKAAIALRGGAQSAWHGLGESIEPDDSLKVIQKKAGLAWEALGTPVIYKDADGNEHQFENTQVVYRSDTRAALGVVSTNRYNIVQPSQVMEFFQDFLSDNKLSIETAGALRGGRIIWCLAKLGKEFGFLMPGRDRIDGYIRLQTSFDGTRATDLIATTIRQVCANTMKMIDAESDRNGYKVNHSKIFDAEALQRAFGLVGDQHKMTAELWNALCEREVTQEEAREFFAEVLGIYTKDIGQKDKDGRKLVTTRTENVFNELLALFASGPGAAKKSANGTAFGLLQAVTRYVDHGMSVQDNYEDGPQSARLNSAWFGKGEQMKDSAQWYAADLAGVSKLIDRHASDTDGEQEDTE